MRLLYYVYVYVGTQGRSRIGTGLDWSRAVSRREILTLSMRTLATTVDAGRCRWSADGARHARAIAGDLAAARVAAPATARFRRSGAAARCHTHSERGRNPNEIADLEELGVVGARRKRGHSPNGSACHEPMLRPTLGALAVAGRDGYWIAAFTGRDREPPQTGEPSHGWPVRAAGEQNLEELHAAGHTDDMPCVVLNYDIPGH